MGEDDDALLLSGDMYVIIVVFMFTLIIVK